MSTGAWPEIPSAAWSRAFADIPVAPPRPKIEGQFDGGPLQGAPLGGIGTGGIGRDFQGNFRRWTLKAGALKHFVEPANGFATWQRVEGETASARPLQPAAEPGVLAAWLAPETAPDGHYHALFPKSWYHYPTRHDRPVELLCEQFSPVLPGNYRETSYPVAVFRWWLRNPGDRPAEAAILFSLANMIGWFDDMGRGKPYRRNAGSFNHSFRAVVGDGQEAPAAGIVFDRIATRTPPAEGNGQMAIAASGGPGVTLSTRASFDARGDGADVWMRFAADGTLDDDDASWIVGADFAAESTGLTAGAVAAKVALAPGETATLTFALAWDLPVLRFGAGREHWRRYTRFWGRGGDHAEAMVRTALSDHGHWSQAIDRWHADIIGRSARPDWSTRLLFNELYLVVDGLTAWTDGPVGGGDPEEFFGLIECPDYPFYDTFDLWVYGSAAIVALWPDIERRVIRDYAAGLLQDDRRQRRQMGTAARFPVNRHGALPHDLGAPDEDPGCLLNSYAYRNSTEWKDLNAQFVVTVCRDVGLLGDDALLADCYPAVRAAMGRLESFDRDGDGLIENDGVPDQTIDNIPMTGPSAYCGGLWLAALAAAAALARRLGQDADAARWDEWLALGRAAFDEKLWTGSYYRLDADSPYRDALFLDQLFGIAYASRAGLGDLVPRERARTALKTLYERCFLALDGGREGAATIVGVSAEDLAAIGRVGDARNQTSEVLVGLNISFAVQLRHYGLLAEADAVLRSIHDGIYRDRALWFRTPAAWDRDAPTFRSIMNMRPLGVWMLWLDGGGRPYV